MLKVEGVTHWSIPVNDLTESETFYGQVLGLEPQGRLGNSGMSCFRAGDSSVLLCERTQPSEDTFAREARMHHAFTVSKEVFESACKTFAAQRIPIVELIYRPKGFFTGRELYFLDPSGNLLEFRDPSWVPGMAEPSVEQIAGSSV